MFVGVILSLDTRVLLNIPETQDSGRPCLKTNRITVYVPANLGAS